VTINTAKCGYRARLTPGPISYNILPLSKGYYTSETTTTTTKHEQIMFIVVFCFLLSHSCPILFQLSQH